MLVTDIDVDLARPVPRRQVRSGVLAPRPLRLAAQLACLAAVGTVEGLGGSPVAALVVAQAVVVLGAFVLPGVGGSEGEGLGRMRGALLHGVVLGAVSVPTLVAMGAPVRVAQAGVVGVLAALWGLGRMRDSFVAAGTQLDAVLATLPPPEPAHSVPADR